MSHDYIHYIPRRIVTRWPARADDPWFAAFQHPADGFERPQVHTSRSARGPARQVAAGDRIWLVGQVHTPWGALPPGLDGCIEVQRVETRDDGALRYLAAPGSAWFVLADASRMLAELQTVAASGQVQPLRADPERPIGHSLQSLRRLVSAAPLVAWAETLRPERAHFISYRLRDGTQPAFQLAARLLAAGEAVYWDRWCLPRRLAERRETVEDAALDHHLMSHLRRARQVWGIESPLYDTPGSYAARERAEALRLGRYRAVPSAGPEAAETAVAGVLHTRDPLDPQASTPPLP